MSLSARIKITGLIERFLSKDALSSKELLCHLRELELLHPKRAGLLDEITEKELELQVLRDIVKKNF